LGNDLAKGRFRVDGGPIALSDIRAKMYCVATEADHVSPWPSVFRLSLLTDTDVTFVLTNGGHNGGILSEPCHAGRHFRCGHKDEGDAHITASDWFGSHQPKDGSWWPHWTQWLKKRSGPAGHSQPASFDVLDAAPGRYVLG
jgi:polyhydroxyalkanoate synthase